MRKHLLVAAVVFFFATVCSAAPPKPSSLREAWQGLEEKCGLLTVSSAGVYEFSLEVFIPGKDQACVLSIGTDVVVLGVSPDKSFLETPKRYLVVPMERVVISVRQ
jgi:hypothetical protein